MEATEEAAIVTLSEGHRKPRLRWCHLRETQTPVGLFYNLGESERWSEQATGNKKVARRQRHSRPSLTQASTAHAVLFARCRSESEKTK